jgi:exopolysaccharide biosynthesis predicted pyruvyltransferase EpsI
MDDMNKLVNIALEYPDECEDNKKALIKNILDQLRYLKTTVTLNTHFMILSSLLDEPLTVNTDTE